MTKKTHGLTMAGAVLGFCAAVAAPAAGAQGGEKFSSGIMVVAQSETPPMPETSISEDELKALTGQVVKSLNQLQGKEEPQPEARENLMEALSGLVEKALKEGKSSSDVLQLIEEALKQQGGASLEEIMAKSGGKLDMRALLDKLVQNAAEKAAQESATADDLTKALRAEGEATVISGGRNNMPGSGKVIVVQRGDTLGTLAEKYLGSAARWRDIFNANRDKLKNPDLVPTGTRLRLP
jgi:nucleoid-associated protein YgaU